MRMDDVVVATITLARTPDEAPVLLDALGRLTRLGLPVCVCDGGSGPSFTSALAALPGVTLVCAEGPGLVGQVRASLSAAAAQDAPFVLYTEPDKAHFFSAHLPAFVGAAPGEDEIGIVIAARSDASFATFPPMQRRTERIASELTAAVLQQTTDYYYGPFLVRRALVPRVDAAAQELGWGWRPFLFVKAHQSGYRVRSVEGAFPCPPDQRGEDAAERAHRLRQLSQNVAGLAQALT